MFIDQWKKILETAADNNKKKKKSSNSSTIGSGSDEKEEGEGEEEEEKGTWQCPDCTLINEHTQPSCNACDRPKYQPTIL